MLFNQATDGCLACDPQESLGEDAFATTSTWYTEPCSRNTVSTVRINMGSKHAFGAIRPAIRQHLPSCVVCSLRCKNGQAKETKKTPCSNSMMMLSVFLLLASFHLNFALGLPLHIPASWHLMVVPLRNQVLIPWAI
jgi:hypothetical protein